MWRPKSLASGCCLQPPKPPTSAVHGVAALPPPRGECSRLRSLPLAQGQRAYSTSGVAARRLRPTEKGRSIGSPIHAIRAHWVRLELWAADGARRCTLTHYRSSERPTAAQVTKIQYPSFATAANEGSRKMATEKMRYICMCEKVARDG